MSWGIYSLIYLWDGTKEFVEKSGEFTVNILLGTNLQPVFGVVYPPASDGTYWGDKSSGALKAECGTEKAVMI